MKASDIIDELKTFYKDGVEYRSLERHLTEADVERWSSECGWSRSQLFDEICLLYTSPGDEIDQDCHFQAKTVDRKKQRSDQGLLGQKPVGDEDGPAALLEDCLLYTSRCV